MGSKSEKRSLFEMVFASEILNLPDQRLILLSDIFKNLLKIQPLFAVRPRQSKWAD